MSIANELSADVAAAVLTEHSEKAARGTDNDLTGIVLEVHSTLRRLTNEARQRRARAVAQSVGSFSDITETHPSKS